MVEGTYHHGGLREALIDAAMEAVLENGPAGISLRDLGRRVGVSHAAATHHFGNKAGILTALAVRGHQQLAEELDEAYRRTGRLLDMGLAYVGFAVKNPALFEVMFRPDLYDRQDEELLAAQARTDATMRGGVTSLPADHRGADGVAAGAAGWAIAHGFASLWITNNFADDLGNDTEAAARRVLGMLFASRGATGD